MNMVEIWIMHFIFMAVFFGFPAYMGIRQYKQWKKNTNSSLLSKIKKDLGMNF